MVSLVKRGDLMLTRAGFVIALGAALWAGASYVRGKISGYESEKNESPQDDGTDARETDGPIVVCQSKSGFYRADPLSSTVSYTVKTPGTGFGADAEAGENEVRIEGGAVRVSHANCANQICVEHDPVTGAGGQIVCLPHGVVVQVAERESDVAKLS